MKNSILVIALFLATMFANAQGQFEQGMGQALTLWGQGKPTEATALFERIASAEKTSWLPNYYIGLVNALEAFNPKNRENMTAMLAKADAAIDIELAKTPNNPELLVVRALSMTALLSSDPMKYGMTMSPQIAGIYGKAAAIAPENPRVVLNKARFDMSGAKWTGADVKKLCADVERSRGLFVTFKPETLFSPSWGADQVDVVLKDCK